MDGSLDCSVEHPNAYWIQAKQVDSSVHYSYVQTRASLSPRHLTTDDVEEKRRGQRSRRHLLSGCAKVVMLVDNWIYSLWRNVSALYVFGFIYVKNIKQLFPHPKKLRQIYFPLLFPTDFMIWSSELESNAIASAFSSRMHLPIRDALRNNPKQTRVVKKFR